MVKLFIVCSKKNKGVIENYLHLQDKYDLVLPSWYVKGDEVADNFSKDIDNLKSCDFILVVDSTLSLYTYCQIYEGYRQNKPIYIMQETSAFKMLLTTIGIEYSILNDLNNLSYSKYIKIDNSIQNLKGVLNSQKEFARILLNDFEQEPTMTYISRDNEIIFEWLSDPEKVDYCKYFVQLILYLDGSCNLKVMYYNEVVRDKKSNDIEYTVGKLNRYVHDFESLMR
jgi:hypothetical protein